MSQKNKTKTKNQTKIKAKVKAMSKAITKAQVALGTAKNVLAGMLSRLASPSLVRISEWADKYRYLSSESSAEPGKWITARAPYQRDIMDAVLDATVRELVIMSSAQVGKTEILNNTIGYYVHLDPAPILLVEPTLEMAESYSKDRLAPMIRDTPVLRDLISDPRSRDSGNTLLHKTFTCGHISIAGANSSVGLASRPIRIVLCDEVDRYPVSAGTEGDPVSLAKKRTVTFRNRKLVLASTPTMKNASRIEAAYLNSDQRHYHVPCPHCGKYQTLKWGQIKWSENKPETAHYECEHNRCIISNQNKAYMLKYGKWVADKPFKGIAGFHINELYSPWVTFEQIVTEFLQAKLLPETMKTWVNTALGEPWEEDGEVVEADVLHNRREDWGIAAPKEVVLVTAGVDVQGDRLEIEVKGWGIGEECWSLDYHIIYGNPAEQYIWQELDKYLLKPIRSATGLPLNIACTCIDSGGHHTQNVYEFCSKKALRGIFAVKGMSQAAKPIIGRPSKNNRFGLRFYTIGTDTAKEVIYSRLHLKERGPGYFHFPIARDLEYFLQLTAEKQITNLTKGGMRREWVKIRTRNEVLDCTVYALAALKLLNTDLEMLAADMAAAVKTGVKLQTLESTEQQSTNKEGYTKWPDARDQQHQYIPKMSDWMTRSRDRWGSGGSYNSQVIPDSWRRRERTNWNSLFNSSR